MGRYGRLLGYLGPYRTIFLVSIGAAVAASVLDGFMLALVIPLLRVLFGVGSAMVDAPTGVERLLGLVLGGLLSSGGQAGDLRNLVGIIVVIVAVKNVASYAAGYLSAHLEEGVTRDLRRDLYLHIQRLGLGFFQQNRSGQLITRMFADLEQVRVLVSQGFQSVLRNGALILVYLAILLSISWRLGLLTLLLAPGLALAMRPILTRVRKRFAESLEARGELSAVIGETVSGARLVKAHAAEPYERRRFSEISETLFARTLRAQRVAFLASPLSETLAAGVFVVLLLVGANAAVNSQALRPELFMAFLIVTLRLLPPVKKLAQFQAVAQLGLAGATRVFDIIDLPADDVDEPGARRFPGLREEIEFRDLWFAYRSDEWVLRGVNLTVPRGQVVALVGSSGSGKSTLVDTLPRFIDPQRGAVLLDGVPTTDYSRRSLRGVLSIVSQETVIFNDTVLANIAYGDERPPDVQAARAAARAAHAHDFIAALPRGYDTLLGERGMTLSGGERQRIAIARVLYRDPPILILDEATSALDAESERLVQDAMARLLENRTVLVIAHRLSTVVRADRIAVLDHGRIVEEGPHIELLVSGGVYQRLHESSQVEKTEPRTALP